jgi:hypothetical protein
VIGFVYILTNQYFAYDVFKIGCTERSPHERAAELSKSTGVPAPFEVLCYMEVENFQLAERAVHEWLKNYRISSNREFFEGGLHHAVCWMWHHPKRLAFCSIPGRVFPVLQRRQRARFQSAAKPLRRRKHRGAGRGGRGICRVCRAGSDATIWIWAGVR